MGQSDKMIKLKDPVYPEGSQLVDVRYYTQPSECYEVILHNPLTNKLEVYYEEPIIDIWFLKKENRHLYVDQRNKPYQVSQVLMEDCYVVSCKPSQISKVIAENMKEDEWCKDYYDYYYENKDEMNNLQMKRHMCECPWVFKADFTEDVYYRLKWIQKYGNNADLSNVTFALLDIECDVLDKSIDMRNIYDVTQPVNAVTLILPHEKICAVLILGPRPKYKLHSKFHDLLEKQEKEFSWLFNHQEEFKRMIKEDDADNKVYISDYDVRLHIFDFDQEINLIKTIFDYINKYRPWFCLSWNAKFDHTYLQNRIQYLGYDPKDIIIPKEFKTKKLYYHEDRNPEADFASSKDWWFTSTYTQYLCQQRLYAAIRKSQQKPRSLKLNYIGKIIAGIEKLTETKSGSFREFAYTDFLKFILYNVRDVVVQLAIELKCNDCYSLYSRSFMYATQYSKCFQETHIVRNDREYFYEGKGYVQSCRLITDPNADSHYKGAFVAPTEKNAPTGNILNGKKINNVIYGALDADASSYYPSTKMGMNQDPMTLLYKCIVDNSVFINGTCSNKTFNQNYVWYDSASPPKPHPEDMTGPIINSYKNGNILSVMNGWFSAPSISEVFKYLDMNY